MSGLLLPAVGRRLGPYFSSRSETSPDPNPACRSVFSCLTTCAIGTANQDKVSSRGVAFIVTASVKTSRRDARLAFATSKAGKLNSLPLNDDSSGYANAYAKSFTAHALRKFTMRRSATNALLTFAHSLVCAISHPASFVGVEKRDPAITGISRVLRSRQDHFQARSVLD